MRKGTWIALASVGLMLAGGGAIWANDTVRLGGPQAQSEISGGTNTEMVRWGRGGYYRGGYGGYYGGGYGYRGGYGYGYGARYYSPGVSLNFYSQPYYSSYYYPRAYYSSSYYTPYYSSAYYYPCAGEVAPTVTLQSASYSMLPAPQAYTPQPTAPRPSQYVPPMPPAGDRSFRYDGEPRNIVPTPAPTNVDPVKGPQRLVPLDGKFVSFGGVSPIPSPNPRNIVGATANSTVRVSYPAYGEEPIAPVRRK